MSELPAPVPRRPVHTRRLAFEGFLRDDGLWDIDCELSDTKAMAIEMRERGRLEPGEPIHLLRVRLTIDDAFLIHDVQTAVHSVPFAECHRAADAPMRKLVGLTMGPGWRKKIEGAIGGVAGCTHLRELVFNAATAAFQMVPHYREVERRGSPNPPVPSDQPPFYMGQCMTWSFQGPVVQRLAPQFYRGVKKDE
ncbi:MAG TPA: DUF2889 domain-containing protein, partial [Ramlibacter sp.]